MVDGCFSAAKVDNCPDAETPAKIKIIYCQAYGEVFNNIISGSIHEVVSPPKGKNNEGGLWVMGVGEPAKVLFGEFVSEEKK